MKGYVKSMLLMLALLAASGCAQLHGHSGPQASDARKTPQQNAGSGYSNQVYAANNQDCANLANQRVSMFARPDTYPISDKEKHDAYQALYTECVNGNTGMVAAAPNGAAPYATANAASYANLSPAAGGTAARGNVVNAGNALVSTSQVPGATVVVIGGNSARDTASQLSSLSPAAGGAAAANPTVVYVQSPTAPAQAAAPVNGYYAAGAPLPVAVPVPPQPQGYYRPATPQAMTQPPAAQARRPSLASADAAATGTATTPADNAANRQLQNVLEK